MRVLQKLVCERCFAMYQGELEADGLKEPEDEQRVERVAKEGGICSICGRVEGQRTVQFTAAEVAAATKEAKKAFNKNNKGG